MSGPIEEEASFLINVADFTLSNSSGAGQNCFEVVNDAFNVGGLSTCEMEAVIQLSALGGGNVTTAILFAGTATVDSIMYWSIAHTAAEQALIATQYTKCSTATTAQVINNASTSASVVIRLTGIVRFSAGGTFIPQIQFSALPGGTPVCNANSYFKLKKLGSSTVGGIGSVG